MRSDWHPGLIKTVVASLQHIFVDQYYADKVISHAFKANRKLGSRDRRYIAETVYDMVRWWNLLAGLDGAPFALSEPKDFVRRWIYYEMWKHNENAVPYIAEKLPEYKNILETSQVIAKKITENKMQPWEDLAFPQWLYERFVKDYGQEAAKILSSLNDPAPVNIRANRLKTDRETLLTRLKAEEIDVEVYLDLPDCLTLKERKNVFTTKAFNEGLFEVQDAASQRIAPLLDPKPGERIADVCAGAGGKTLHLAALMQNKGTLLAGDVMDRKLEELKTRARRAGVSNLRIQKFETSKDIKKHDSKFDGILIDAPCSGTGVIRRNPDSKWKLTPEEVERLKTLQTKVLNDYARMVRPGGRLVYATCSLLKEENQGTVLEFLKTHPQFETVGDALIRRPDLHKEDGFFAQKFVRKN